uniref:Uncharacterized protein n=1 Tax=Macrostomum lignano TaxID=282301 RepID=A0A1I8FK34_9PLAT
MPTCKAGSTSAGSAPNLVSDSVQGCVDRVGTKKIKVTYCHCRGRPELQHGCLTARRPAADGAAAAAESGGSVLSSCSLQ